MAKITKSLSTKVNKQTGKVEVYFRFIGSSSLVLRAKSGIYINPKQWNAKKSDLKTATFGNDEAEIKSKLDNLCTTILNSFTQTDRGQVTKEWLNIVIDKFHNPIKYEIKDEVIRKTFFEEFEEFLNTRNLSEVRKRNFRVIYRTLKRYEMYRGVTLDLDTITDATLRDIDVFLRGEYMLCEKPKYQKILALIPESRTPQPRGQNTINDIFTKLRTFLLWCVDEKKTTNLPKIEIKECVYGTPYYINIEERKQIERTDLSAFPQLAIQRDIFVFQCCIGCRVGDLYKMTKQNVVGNAIQYVPRKTKDGNPVTVTVPLNDTAKNILNRYKGLISSLFPFISSQKYNDAIKKIFKLSGVNRVVQVRNPLTGEFESKPISDVASSHLARRTFVGNIYKQVKDPNLVGVLSGHKQGSRAFARYRDIDTEMKVELVKMLE